MRPACAQVAQPRRPRRAFATSTSRAAGTRAAAAAARRTQLASFFAQHWIALRRCHAKFDIAFEDFSDRDAGFYAKINGNPNTWMKPADLRRHLLYGQTFMRLAGVRIVAWQIPLGNTVMRAMSNTWDFQDNRVQWLLGPGTRARLGSFAAAGFAGVLLGRGADDPTCARDAAKDGATNPPPIDGNTRMALSAADDGGYFKAQVRAYSPGRRDRSAPVTVVACLGDSITEGSPYWDSRAGRGDPEGQWEHWAGLRLPELTFRNFGIWGERTDEIAARFDEAVDGADVLIVQGGINDIAQGCDVAAAARNLSAMIEHGLALGLPVAVCDVLPWNNGWPEKDAAIRQLNARIHELGVPVLPFHATLEDPERPGRMKEEWTNEDGDHPSIAGYRRLGEVAFVLP